MSAGDVPPQPRVFESIGQAWTNMWPAFWVLLAFLLIELVVTAPSQVGEFLPEGQWVIGVALGGLGFLLTFFVSGPLGVGVTRAHLKVSRGDKPEFGDLGYGFGRYWQAVLLTVLSFLIVFVGFILLILPGIYLAVRLTFAATRFVDDELDAMEAIQASWEDTRGRWWRTFGLLLMAIPLVIAGLLAFGVGIFVALVWVEQMMVVYWRSIAQD